MRKDEVEASWKWIDSINESWAKANLKITSTHPVAMDLETIFY